MATRKKEAQPTALIDLVTPTQYVEGRPHVFRSMEAWRWFLRANRAELFERGAVIEIGGKNMVHAQKHDEAVLAIGAIPRRTCRDEAAA